MSAVTVRDIIPDTSPLALHPPSVNLISASAQSERLRQIGTIIRPICEAICEALGISNGEDRALVATKLSALTKQELAILEYLFVVELAPETILNIVRGASLEQIDKLQYEILGIGRQINTITATGSGFEDLSFSNSREVNRNDEKERSVRQLARDLAIILRLDTELTSEQITTLKTGQINPNTGMLVLGDGFRIRLSFRLLEVLSSYQVACIEFLKRDLWEDSRSQLFVFDDGEGLLKIADSPETAEDRADEEMPEDLPVEPESLVVSITQRSKPKARSEPTQISRPARQAPKFPALKRMISSETSRPAQNGDPTQLKASPNKIPQLPANWGKPDSSPQAITATIETLTEVWRTLEGIRKSGATNETKLPLELIGTKAILAITKLKSRFEQGTSKNQECYYGAIMELAMLQMQLERLAVSPARSANRIAAAQAVIEIANRTMA